VYAYKAFNNIMIAW